MEKIIKEKLYRKMLLLDEFEEEEDVYHKLLPYHSNYRYIITGPRMSGRTSLLFELCFQAAEKNLNVLYIACNQISQLPHFHAKRTQPKTDILSRIHILYPKSFEECIGILGGIHKKETLYSLIIMDDLEKFLPQDKSKFTQCSSLLLALVIDVVAYCSKKTGTNTMLLCSMCYDSTVYQTFIDIMDRWILNQIRLYLTPRQCGNGFSLKSETKITALSEQIDIDIVGIRATFENNRIILK